MYLLKYKHYDEAIKSLEIALQIRKTCYTLKNKKIMESLDNIGKYHFAVGNNEEALQKFEESLQLKE